MSQRPTRSGALGGAPLSRRGLLQSGLVAGGGALALALTGCGNDGSRVLDSGQGAPKHALLAAYPQSVPHVAVGVPTRLPFLISDAEGVPMSSITGPVSFTVSRDGTTVADNVVVQPRSDGVPRAYLPLTVTFPELGVYDIATIYEGARLDSQVQVYSLEDVAPPVVGEALPPLVTPTSTDPLQVDPLCSRVPACPFHEVSLNTAVASGKRVVMLVASPAYCQSAICGPVLDNLIEVAGSRSDIVVIHCEVYKNPKAVPELSQAALAPVPKAYSLTFEPVLFVADGTGRITSRADVIVDKGEMAELIG
jgi:hypothetical protein